MKFKPGDKVRCIVDFTESPDHTDMGPTPKRGDVLTVLKVGLSKDRKGISFFCQTCQDSVTKVEVGYSEDCFEMVAEHFEMSDEDKKAVHELLAEVRLMSV